MNRRTRAHKNFVSAVWRSVLAILSGIGSVPLAGANSSADIRIPSGDVPVYARLGRGEFYHDSEWAVVIFYRPPTCIPASFNLLDVFDVPAAFACKQPTTTGFEVWSVGPGLDPELKLSELRGRGAVPVWFVRWPVLQAAVADGILTIGKLTLLQPLVGWASTYHETLRPAGLVKVCSIEIDASGTLEDGRSFQVNAHGVDFGQLTRIAIR